MKLHKVIGGLEQVTQERIRFTPESDEVVVRVGPDGSISGKIPFLELDKNRRYRGMVEVPFTGKLRR